MEGWIKLHRKLLDHWIFKNEKYLKAWIWFLLKANHKENKILMGAEIMDIERGEFVTSIYKICEATGLTSQNVRTLIRLLENDQMINKRTTSKLTKITILNYDSYQIDQQTDNKQTNKPLTSAQQTANKPVTTDNNDKNENNDKKNIIATDFIGLILIEFQEVYKILRNVEYEITNVGKERSAAGKLLNIYKKNVPDKNSEETLSDLRLYFERCINISDPWLYNNMSLSMIASKFNEIRTILRHGNKQGKGATDAEIAELFAKHFGK